MRFTTTLVGLLISFAVSCNALSQSAPGGAVRTYPVKPIRIIVPFAAGGPTDTHSRWAAQQLTAAVEDARRGPQPAAA